MPDLQFHTRYQVLPEMPPDQFAALKADIAARGVQVPIDITEAGDILDGHHRYRACCELGITDFPVIVRPGLSEEERRLFARNNNMLRRHLTRQQVRRLIADQLRDTPGWANNRIARALGVDKKTVQAERRRLETTGEIPKLGKLEGADGRTRSETRRPAAIMAPNLRDLERILARLPDVDPDRLDGFLSAQGLIVVSDPDYDPFARCDDEGKRAWLLFTEHLGGAAMWPHVEWLLRHQFTTPDEWLGDEGARWRKVWGMKPIPEKFIKGWKAFLARHEVG